MEMSIGERIAEKLDKSEFEFFWLGRSDLRHDHLLSEVAKIIDLELSTVEGRRRLICELIEEAKPYLIELYEKPIMELEDGSRKQFMEYLGVITAFLITQRDTLTPHARDSESTVAGEKENSLVAPLIEALRELDQRLESEFFVLTAPNTDGRALADFIIEIHRLAQATLVHQK